MGEFATINFPCPACGAEFALSEKVARRKIQCPCGRIFVAPAMPESLPDPEAYDIARTVAPPTSKAPPKNPIAAAMASRMALHPHRSVKSFSMDDSEPEYSVVRDRIVPIVLLIVGVGMRIFEIPHDRTLNYGNLPVSLAMLGLQILIAVALMLCGVLAAAKILGANYGPAGTAILKLAAIAVFAWAVGAYIVIVFKYDFRAFFIAIHVMFIIYAAAFASLFSLHLQEALVTVVICTLLQDAAALVIF